MPLLSVSNLRTHFHTRAGVVRAVDGVTFEVEKGGTVGIVGESGSGKSVLCQSVMGLVPSPPGKVSSDGMVFDGMALHEFDGRSMRRVRGSAMTMVFQDPMTSLNPYMRIIDQIVEPAVIHGVLRKGAAVEKAVKILGDVGISDAARRIRQYPYEFSGGMRQRVCIAMALMTDPKLVFADEPTTALDVTVQAQILELIRDLQARYGIAVVLVTHDFGIVSGLCGRIMVMYAGIVVETGPTAVILAHPRHPYTAALLESLPARAAPGRALYSIPGQPPDPLGPVQGCPFAPRCGFAIDACAGFQLALRTTGEGRASACLRIQSGEIGDTDILRMRGG